MVAKPSKKTLEAEGAWERAIQWMMADFGFRRCPIFLVEVLEVHDDEVVFSDLRCFFKDAPTILAASRRPCQLHPGATDPATLLPPAEHVEWAWRDKKMAAIGKEFPSCELVEMPEIAAQRLLSTLSTRNRARRLEEILEATERQEWAERLQEIANRREEARELRRMEIERMREIVEAKRKVLDERATIRSAVLAALSRLDTKKLREVSGQRWKILGHREALFGPRVVLEDEEGQTVSVYSTRQLAKLLENTKELFLRQTDTYSRELFVAASQKQKMEIRVEPTKAFWNTEGEQILWNPISIEKYPDPQKLDELRQQLDEAQKYLEEARPLEDLQKERLRVCAPPQLKDWTKAVEMKEGRYLVTRYGKRLFRGVEKTALFLQAIGDDGAPTEDFDKPVWGHFLQQEIDKTDIDRIEGFLYCQLGREKTTGQKKKDRLAALFYSSSNDQAQEQ